METTKKAAAHIFIALVDYFDLYSQHRQEHERPFQELRRYVKT